MKIEMFHRDGSCRGSVEGSILDRRPEAGAFVIGDLHYEIADIGPADGGPVITAYVEKTPEEAVV